MTYEQVVKQPGWGDALTFAAAIEPMAIAEHLILHTDKHRERLLSNAWIIWTWSGKPLVKGGKACMGITKLVPQLWRDTIREFFNVDDDLDGDFSDEHIAEDLYTPPAPQFLVQLCTISWGRLNEKQRIALVDHELCHMDCSSGKPKIRPHDLAEFAEIVERHGIWDMDTAQFVTALQPHLPGFADAALKQSVRDTQALCDAPVTVNGIDPALGRAFDALKQAVDDSGATVRLHVPATGQTAVLGGTSARETLKADPDDPDSLDVTVIKHELSEDQRKHLAVMLAPQDDGVVGTIGQAAASQ